MSNLPVTPAPVIRLLPSLADLHHSPAEAFKQDALLLLLNQPPHEKWLKRHPIIPNHKYLPVDKVEFLLTRIFQNWKFEILREGVMFHSVYVCGRLHYQNPVSGEWSYHDGLGAVPVQTDAGASAADLKSIKSNAVTIALPSAESFSLKDAAEKLGTLFGKDLNRKDVIAFQGAYSAPVASPVDEPPIDQPSPEFTPDAESIYEL